MDIYGIKVLFCVFFIAGERQLTAVDVGVTQSQLDSIASDLFISAEVLDNLKNSTVSHTVKLELHNTGRNVVPSTGWKLFFHSIYLLLPTIFPQTLSTVSDIENINISMHGGDLYSLQPADNFKPILANESRVIEFEVAVWSISETDFMPNWYFVSTRPGIEPRIASSTESIKLDFVKPFDDVRQWKRYDFDRYNPFTPQARMNHLYVKDNNKVEKPVIPTPLSISVVDGSPEITINATWSILKEAGSTDKVADYAAGKLGLQVSSIVGPKTIRLSVAEPPTGKQGYDLNVDPIERVIRIQGKDEAGLFYGIQSLLSLLASFPSGLPEISITDEPRFEFRGMHVDVARNFHTTEDLKRLMDAMAMYKMNALHLHLTDDEGWRLQIPDLPELTTVGARRCHDLQESECIIPQYGSGPFTNTSGSGFYTTNDYKDLLRYADERFIEVIPEFDMPGHAHAAIRSMEERYNKRAGTAAAEEFRLIDPDDTSFYISVQQWMDNAINPCIESTYNFIATVLDTVVELHRDIQPLKTYHFGGDEVAKGAWENSTKCKQFLQNNPKYNIPKGLKKYFVERVANLTAARNLGMRGWEDGFMDEDGNPFPLDQIDNMDMSANPWDNIWEWGVSQRAYKLANAGYKVVMSQGTDLYFDHPYEPDPMERGLYWATRFTDTRKTFGFLPDLLYDNIDVERSGKPLTKEDVCEADLSKCDTLEKRENIIGIQGQLWSETVRTSENFDYMIFPRLLALAERAWYKADFEDETITVGERKRREDQEWEKFANTLGRKELQRLDSLNISYRIPPPGARVTNGKVEYSVTFPGLKVEFSTDNGTSWKELISGDNDVWGDLTVMHLRTRSGNRYSREVELLKDEPLPWVHQDIIDYIGSHLTVRAGVVDNLNKDANNYIVMHLDLTNSGDSLIQKGRWKLYFTNLYGVKDENLDCGLSVVHVNGDLYYFKPTSLFSDLLPGRSVSCTWRQMWWNTAKSDFFPNWYVSSDGMTPRVIVNTNETLNYVLPYDVPMKWKRTTEDKYNPYTTEERYEMYKTTFSGTIDRIIPTPSDIIQRPDVHDIDLKGWVILESTDFPKEAHLLADTLMLQNVSKAPSQRYIYLKKYSVPGSSQETYQLDINTETILIQAAGRPGAFYGIQSLISLWETGGGSVPSWRIDDKPRFSYRGIMIDTARNFKPKEWLFKLLDAMAMYKLNKLHLHLSDDEAWRLEIPGLPELTEMGSNRCQNQDRDVCLIPQRGSGPDKTLPGSGFYTTGDYREILQYAADRYITVIPEIDMPGHSRAAITSMEYRDAKKEKLHRQGSDTSSMPSYPLSDDNVEGDIKSIQNWRGSALNPCMNSTYDFISKVLDELMVMHGGVQILETFHIGGDEVAEGPWDDSPACKRMYQNIDTAVLKRDFVKRVADIVAEKGLDVAAWEDGVYANNRPNPITDYKSSHVYSYAWHNIWEDGHGKRSAEFADEGYKVILAMATHLYLDFPYEADPEEMGLYWATRYIDTKKIFGFMPDDIFANAEVNKMGEPLDMAVLCQDNACPKTNKTENVIGMQGTMFSDLIRTEDQMHYALFPKLLGVAERAWHKAAWEDITDKSKRDEERRSEWDRFASTLGHQELPRLEKHNFHYRVPPPGAIIDGDILKVNTLYPNHDVQMSTDGGKTWSVVENNRHLYRGNYEIQLRTISKLKERPSRAVSVSRSFSSSARTIKTFNTVILTLICLPIILLITS